MADYIKFTHAAVGQIQIPARGRVYYRDQKDPSLGLVVSSTGKKSFYLHVTENRQTRRITLGKYPQLSVALARDLAKTKFAQVIQGIDPIAEKRRAVAMKTTLRNVLDDYIKNKDLKPITINDYRIEISQSFSDWRNKPLAEITPDMIRRRYIERGKSSKARADLGRRVLSALFNYAKHRYKTPDGKSCFPENPVRIISDLKIGFSIPRRKRVIGKDQMSSWWKAVNHQSEHDRNYLAFLAFTGCRLTESKNLDWQDVNVKRGIFALVEPKNRESDVVLPLPDTVLRMIRPHTATTGPVFPCGDVPWLIKKVRLESGVEFSAHDLRRTFITTGNSLDISVYTVKALANHKISTSDVTAGYDIPDMERLRIASQKIEAALLRQVGCFSENVVHINR